MWVFFMLDMIFTQGENRYFQTFTGNKVFIKAGGHFGKIFIKSLMIFLTSYSLGDFFFPNSNC